MMALVKKEPNQSEGNVATSSATVADGQTGAGGGEVPWSVAVKHGDFRNRARVAQRLEARKEISLMQELRNYCSPVGDSDTSELTPINTPSELTVPEPTARPQEEHTTPSTPSDPDTIKRKSELPKKATKYQRNTLRRTPTADNYREEQERERNALYSMLDEFATQTDDKLKKIKKDEDDTEETTTQAPTEPPVENTPKTDRGASRMVTSFEELRIKEAYSMFRKNLDDDDAEKCDVVKFMDTGTFKKKWAQMKLDVEDCRSLEEFIRVVQRRYGDVLAMDACECIVGEARG